MITEVSASQASIVANLALHGEQRVRQNDLSPQQGGDVVSINKPGEMTDEEIAQAMQSVEDNVAANRAEALSVHGGLDYSRVMALLGDLAPQAQ